MEPDDEKHAGDNNSSNSQATEAGSTTTVTNNGGESKSGAGAVEDADTTTQAATTTALIMVSTAIGEDSGRANISAVPGDIDAAMLSVQSLLDAGADVADYAAQPQTQNLLLSNIPMIDYAYNESYLGELDNSRLQLQLGNNPPRMRMRTIFPDSKVIDCNEDKDAKVRTYSKKRSGPLRLSQHY